MAVSNRKNMTPFFIVWGFNIEGYRDESFDVGYAM